MKSDAKKKADNKWDAKAYDKVLLRIRKDTEPTKETILKYAENCGESLNGYIMRAIKERIENT